MAKIKKKKSERLFPKIAFLSLAIVIASAGGLGIVYEGIQRGNYEPKEASDISGGFGSAYGISNITRQDGNTSSGGGSVSVDFQIDPLSDSAPASYSIQYMGEAIAGLTSGEVVNVIAKEKEAEPVAEGETPAPEKAEFDFSYYAAAPSDYKDGSFKSVNDVFDGLYSLGAKSVDIKSTPTLGGGRSTDVTMTVAGWSYEAGGIKTLWNSAVSTISSQGDLEGNNLYNVTIVNSATSDKSVAAKISATFYDQASLEKSQNIDDRIWQNISVYSNSNNNFTSLGIKEIDYRQSLGDTRSKMTVILAGDQPDAATITKAGDTFRQASIDNEDVWYFNTYMTSLKYVNSTDDVWTEYSSNIVY